MMILNASGINKVIENFLNNIDCYCEVKMDSDFAYYYSKDVITYSILVSEKMDRLFYQFAIDNGLKINCGIFIMSLMHEVGHYFTIEDIDDVDYNYCQDVKFNLTDSEEDSLIYMGLADEIAATEWAINYINNHPNKIQKFAEDVQIEIKKFIEKYDLRLDN